MRINSLRLSNFRAFDTLDVRFHEHLTVIIAPNGGGKTAVLEGIAIALSPFVKGIGISEGKSIRSQDAKQSTISAGFDSAKIPAPFPVVTVQAQGEDDNASFDWKLQKLSEYWGLTSKDANPLKMRGINLLQLLRDESNARHTLLPIVALYGTSRLFGSINRKRPPKSPLRARPDGYKGWASQNSRFAAFHDWFRDAYLSVMLGRMQGKRGESDPEHFLLEKVVENVRSSIRLALKPYADCWLDYRSADFAIVLNDHTRMTQLRLEQLSDGVQVVVGVVGDIAARCGILNPQLGGDASRLTPGIVLIDEVDLHLHPQWQQLILKSLQDTFPKMQFIVSTHSPQVLSTVQRENIRVLGPDNAGNIFASTPLAKPYGIPSGDVLLSIMAVDPQPPIPEMEELQRLTALVDQGQYDGEETLRLMKQVTEALGEQHPQLQRLQRSVLRQKALKQ